MLVQRGETFAQMNGWDDRLAFVRQGHDGFDEYADRLTVQHRVLWLLLPRHPSADFFATPSHSRIPPDENMMKVYFSFLFESVGVGGDKCVWPTCPT